MPQYPIQVYQTITVYQTVTVYQTITTSPWILAIIVMIPFILHHTEYKTSDPSTDIIYIIKFIRLVSKIGATYVKKELEESRVTISVRYYQLINLRLYNLLIW